MSTKLLFFSLLNFLLLGSTIGGHADQQSEYDYLDSLAEIAGTDKSSRYHNYTKLYSEYFGSIKNQPIKFLEIGILGGSSVKLWESYFPNAELHFIDCSFDSIQYWSKRAQYHLIDQTNAKALKNFGKKVGGNFDVIIDDGGHTMDQQIISFKALFPFVKSGGMYIIEDLHTSYWQPWGGGGTREHPKSGPNTCVGFLQQLIDDLNYIGARTGMADHDKISDDLDKQLNYYQKNIHSMHFYDSVCIIRKR